MTKINKLPKYRAFDKFINFAYECEISFLLMNKEQIFKNLFYRANCGEHYVQIAYLIFVRDIIDFEVLKKCSCHTIEHPRQSGALFYILMTCGYYSYGINYYVEKIQFFKNLGPAYHSQMISWGDFFEATREIYKNELDCFNNYWPNATEFKELLKPTAFVGYNFL